MLFFSCAAPGQAATSADNDRAENALRPNVILAMGDDIGWSQVAFNGTNDVVKTPCLDEMARNSIRFTRFYTASPHCSPTRGSVLMGRHPTRFHQIGHVAFPAQEVTIAEVLQAAGYATGHFGKWHMGGNVSKNGRCNPGNSGFDEWFSTPDNSIRFNPNEYHRNGVRVGVIEGEDNQILMDGALDFIRKNAEQDKPFLAVIWFHTSHTPFDASPEFRALYKDLPERDQMKWGDISTMDAQMGRLREELRRLKIADNTMLCFCTDNGMDGPDLREGKSSLYEGGIRVPSLIEWPRRVTKPIVTDVPCGTVDYYPTILEALGLKVEGQPLPLDGISLLTLFDGKMDQRPQPLAFWYYMSEQAVIDNRYKIFVNLREGRTELYDLAADPKEKVDLAGQHPEIVNRLQKFLQDWIKSVTNSQEGKDYSDQDFRVISAAAVE